MTIDPTDPGAAQYRKGALSGVPGTFNFLSPLGFSFIIKRAPNVNYDVVRINLPSLVLPSANEPTPFINLPKPGEHLEFAPLIVQFKIDEFFNNYLEIWKWMMALGRIPNPGVLKRLESKPYWTGEAATSEILLTILDSSRQVNIIVTFHDCFPTSLSELAFDAQTQDVPYLTGTTQFVYSFFEIEQVNNAAAPSVFPAELVSWPTDFDPPYVPSDGGLAGPVS